MAQIDNLRRIAEALDGIDKDDNVYNETQDDYLARIAKALENGGGGGSSGGMVVELSIDAETNVATMNKTFNEIKDALENGTLVVAKLPILMETDYMCNFYRIYRYYTSPSNNQYSVTFADNDTEQMHNYEFFADNENGYPSMRMG